MHSEIHKNSNQKKILVFLREGKRFYIKLLVDFKKQKLGVKIKKNLNLLIKDLHNLELK